MDSPQLRSTESIQEKEQEEENRLPFLLIQLKAFAEHGGVWRDAAGQAGEDPSRMAQSCWVAMEESHVADIQASPACMTIRHHHAIHRDFGQCSSQLQFKCDSIISKSSCPLQMTWLYVYNDLSRLCMKYIYLRGSRALDNSTY